MTDESPAPSPGSPRPPAPLGATMLPTSRGGWAAVVAAAIGLGSWIVLPLVTSLFADEYPVTDTFVMPAIGLALTVVAAVVNVLVLWPGRQRSTLNVIATVLTVSATLFFGFFVVGEGLGGA
jgi:hypothetical protein